MISFHIKDSSQKTEKFLARLQRREQFAGLERYGAKGVAALSAATPVESRLTARSWTYKIIQKPGYFSIVWHNTNVEGGVPIAVLLQYGHGTKNGGYVQGRDYINPAIVPIFDQIVADMWKVVTK